MHTERTIYRKQCHFKLSCGSVWAKPPSNGYAYEVVTCSPTVTMPIKPSSYTAWSTSETAAFVQLPLKTMLFCCAEVHVRSLVFL